MNDIRKELRVEIESPYFDEAYARALADPTVPDWLTEEHLCFLSKECGILPHSFDLLLEARRILVGEPALCLLTKTVYHILAKRKKYSESFTAFSIPEPSSEEKRIAYELFAAFPVLAHARITWEELLARGVDRDVATDSLLWTDTFLKEAEEKHGRPCYPKEYFAAYSVGIYVDSLIVGRLRFQIGENYERPVRVFKNKSGAFRALMDKTLLHSSGHVFGSYGCEDETDAYPANLTETVDAYEGHAVNPETGLAEHVRTRLSKSEWTPVFTSGDTVLRVHIPGGKKLDHDACIASYARAKELFGRCYPEYHFGAFMIGCWMLSPVLREILPPTSNIVAFASDYTVFPIQNNALDAFGYVFGIHPASPSEIDLSALPEDNSIRRGIKAKSMEGKYVHQFGGFMEY